MKKTRPDFVGLTLLSLLGLECAIFFLACLFLCSPSASFALKCNMELIPRFRTPKIVYTWNKQEKMVPSNILILTSGRSGSSFLGEIFKRSDRNTGYVFEPLRRIIGNVFIDDHLKFKAIDVVSKLFRCSNMSNGINQFSKQEKNVSVSEKTSRTCLSNKNIVIKELTKRFPENGSSVLENLLWHSKSWNMRVIHLVRDPRHVIPSMQRLGWITGNATTQEQQIRSVCETIWNNIEYGTTSNYDLIHNYKLVVFRNMMMRPYKTAEELYAFAGMGTVPIGVRAWIESSTNAKGNFDSSLLAFTTTRNTTKILNRKIAMSNVTTRFVQKHCGNIISFIQGFYEKELNI